MSTVAEQLRRARESKNLTVQQVAEMTKIRTDHIRALEEGNFDVFSAPIYIRGSVKNYANALKLDVAPLLALLEAELGRTENFSEPPPLVESRKTLVDHITFLLAKLNWKVGFAGLVFVLIVVLAGAGYYTWKHQKNSGPTKNPPPSIYQPTNSGDMLPLPRR